MHDQNVDYKKMYFKLFRSILDTMDILSSAMMDVEEDYIDDAETTDEALLRLLAECVTDGRISEEEYNRIQENLKTTDAIFTEYPDTQDTIVDFFNETADILANKQMSFEEKTELVKNNMLDNIL